MKIIILANSLYFSDIKKKLGLKNELDEYDLEYWSLYNLEIRKLTNIVETKEEKTIIIKTEKEILNRIELLNEKTLIISFHSINFKNLKIYQKIRSKKIKTVFIYVDNIPDINNNFNKKLKRIFAGEKKVIIKKIRNTSISFLYKIVLKRFLKNTKNDIFLYSGRKEEENILNKINLKNNKLVPVKSGDLENYLKLNIVKEKQIVFIDQNIANHQDFKNMGILSIDEKIYYEKLNKAFDLIEKELKMKVVIAAHPSSSYEKDLFLGRKIVQNQTIEEIKKSYLVIGHYSTILGLVTVENKPLVLLQTNEFNRIVTEYIQLFSEIFGVNILNIDNLNENEFKEKIKNIKIDSQKYQNYYEDYLFNGGENRDNSIKSIILKELEKKGER